MHFEMCQSVAGDDRVRNLVFRRHRGWVVGWSRYRRRNNDWRWSTDHRLAADHRGRMLGVRILPPSPKRRNQTDNRERHPDLVSSLARIQRRISLLLSFAARRDGFEF